MDILKLNAISPLADKIMQGYDLVDESAAPVGILVRSANMAEYDLPSSVLAVARAGAGVNNIPHADYAKRGVVVFNTPGANANAVKEMVICEFMLAARNLAEGISWASSLTGDDVAKQVEKGKKRFVGHEILGKTLCVLGLGAIGRKVAVAANALGMKVRGYDPYLSDAARAEIPFVEVRPTAAEAYENAEFVSLHMPATEETKGMINSAAIAKMADGVIIVNAARGELAVTADVKAAIAEGKVHKYVCDFPTAEINDCDGILAVPHLGASTEEAEDNCAVMAANELKDYIENGNIVNSVNLPCLKVELGAKHRVAVIAKEGVVLPTDGISSTAKGYTYTLIDTDSVIDSDALKGIDGVIKVRVIK